MVAQLRPWVSVMLRRLPFEAGAAAIAHGLRMVANLVVIKMIALALGPDGLGAIGNLISVLSIVMVFAGGGIANGIAKYSAEHQGRARPMFRLIETALAIGLSVSGTVMIVCIVAAVPISKALFASADLWWLVPLLGISHFAAFIGSSTIALANGHHRADLFAAISISAYLGSIVCAWALITLFGFVGASLALMVLAGSTAVPSLWLLLRSRLKRLLSVRFHKVEAQRLLRFSAMTLASAISFPVAEIVLRNSIIATLDLTQAGLWQASIRLSGAILGFYTVYLATSYMPHVSAEPDPEKALPFILRSLLRIGSIFAVIAVGIYLLRDFVIPLLFSDEFLPLAKVLGWQLLGDTFRVGAYCIGFVVIARARLALHIGAEILQYSLFILIGLACLHLGGSLEWVLKGYALSYGIYLLIGLAWLGIWGRRLA